MPNVGQIDGDLSGCNRLCAEGHYGDASNHITSDCSGPCWLGHFCREGSVLPQKCPAGTHMPNRRAASISDCFLCAPGQYQPESGQEECLPCAAGSFSPDVRSAACEACPKGGVCEDAGAATRLVWQPCPAGSFNPNRGSSSSAACELCPIGTASAAPGAESSETCEPCEPGYFAATHGLSKCERCSAGSYQNDTGATSCRDCEAGSYCEPGASRPLPCEGGSYSDKTNLSAASQCAPADPGYIAARGATEQTACGEGSFANGTRNEVCELCAEGSYQGATAASECTAASPGYFATTGSTQQTPCAKGSYAVTFGLTKCELCAGGTYQDDTGATGCLACKQGSYCAEGAAAPLPCEKGSYSRATNLTAASECTACPAGSACSTGSVEPTPCSPGTFAAEEGQAKCEACPPGTSSDRGSDSCDACEAGRYAANAGQGLCNRCPHPLSSVNGSTTCSFCIDDYYLRNTVADPEEIYKSPAEYCKPCPPNAACPDNTTLSSLVLPPGFWRASPSSAVLTACRGFGGERAGEARCAGSEPVDDSRRRTMEEAGSEYCASDFNGPECQLCAAENHYLVDGDKCQECTPRGAAAGRIVGLVLGLCVACGLAAYCYSMTEWREKSYIGLLLRLADRAVYWYVAIGLTAKLKILFGFYQICTVLSSTYSARLPEEYTGWTDRLANAMSIDWSGVFLPEQCLGYALRLLAIALSPVALIALLMVAGISLRLHGWRAAPAPRERSWYAEAALGLLDLTPAGLVLIFCFVPSISASIFRSWSCQAPSRLMIAVAHTSHPSALAMLC